MPKLMRITESLADRYGLLDPSRRLRCFQGCTCPQKALVSRGWAPGPEIRILGNVNNGRTCIIWRSRRVTEIDSAPIRMRICLIKDTSTRCMDTCGYLMIKSTVNRFESIVILVN